MVFERRKKKRKKKKKKEQSGLKCTKKNKKMEKIPGKRDKKFYSKNEYFIQDFLEILILRLYFVIFYHFVEFFYGLNGHGSKQKSNDCLKCNEVPTGKKEQKEVK